MNKAHADDWQRFAREVWERSATAGEGELRDVQHSLPPAMFSALVAAAQECIGGSPDAKFCLWVSGVKQDVFDNLLPRQSDGSLKGYDERMRHQLDDAEYTLLLGDPHAFSTEVWAQCGQVCGRFLPYTGLPNGWLDTAIFLGTYRTTPFGVHQGPMSVFTVPLVGRKKFRLWSSEYVGAHPDIVNAMEYQRHLADSYELSAGPGGFIYWPSREWHVAEADNTMFTAALSIGVWCNPADHHPLWAVAKLVEKMLSREPLSDIEHCDRPYLSGGSAGPDLPASLEYYVERLERYARSGQLRREALGMLLQQHSTHGFKVAPQRRDYAPVQLKDVLSRDRRMPIVTASTHVGDLVVGANGHAISVTDVPGVHVLLAWLEDAPESFTPAKLFEDQPSVLSSGLTSSDCLAILHQLLAAGCLTRLSHGHAAR